MVDDNDLPLELPVIQTKNVAYAIEFDRKSTFYKVKTDKGMLPVALRGLFTSVDVATKKINNYIIKTNKEVI